MDLTLTKGFGLPNMPVLGENAKFELRMDAYNVFNNLKFNPNLEISNNIDSANFGAIAGALSGRVISLGRVSAFRLQPREERGVWFPYKTVRRTVQDGSKASGEREVRDSCRRL